MSRCGKRVGAGRKSKAPTKKRAFYIHLEKYAGAEKKVKQLNEKPNKKELFWVVTTIGV